MTRRSLIIVFLLGVAAGATGALFGPRLIGPHLPGFLGGTEELVEGKVLRKELQEDRLLLTILTERGAILATFREQTAELNLLVDEGDTLLLGLQLFEPFVTDPRIESVRKPAAPVP